MNDQAELSPKARLGFAVLMLAAGLMPMLAAFDVGPLRRSDINGPPWLGFVAGAVFFVGGVLLLVGDRLKDHPLGYLLLFLVLGAFAAIGWIAFGAGTRSCGVSVAGLFFSASRGATDLMCRGAFGLGALMLNGVLIAMLAHGAGRLAGPGPFAARADSVGKGVLLVSVAPVLIPLLLVLLLKVAFETVRERLRTGRWPRNEKFIARMKLKKERAEA